MTIANIDVTKIDKTLLFQGKKGTYMDLVFMENKDGTNEYGQDGMVVQGVDKEKRLAGVRGPILGNYKIVKTKNILPFPASTLKDDQNDGIPF